MSYAQGLLVNGALVAVPGAVCWAPASHGGPPWARLNPSPADYRARKGRCQQGLIHTTKGIDPQRIVDGAGPVGRPRRVADFWFRDDEHSAAHLISGSDGEAACLADIGRIAAFHATVSNDLSFGLEIYQEADGTVFTAALDTAVKLMDASFAALSLPRYFVADPYRNAPLKRFSEDGGKDYYGALGHRNNTSRRGRGDPGDEIWRRLQRAGWIPVQAEQREDLELSKSRQRFLNRAGAARGIPLLVVDGLPGPASMRAAAAAGYLRWEDIPLDRAAPAPGR